MKICFVISSNAKLIFSAVLADVSKARATFSSLIHSYTLDLLTFLLHYHQFYYYSKSKCVPITTNIAFLGVCYRAYCNHPPKDSKVYYLNKSIMT